MAQKAGAAGAHFHALDVSKTASVEHIHRVGEAQNRDAEIPSRKSPRPDQQRRRRARAGHGGRRQGRRLGNHVCKRTSSACCASRAPRCRCCRTTTARASSTSAPSPGARPMRARRRIARRRPANWPSPACCGTNCSAPASASARWIRGWRRRNFPSCVSKATQRKATEIYAGTNPLRRRRHRRHSRLDRQPPAPRQH